MRIRTRNATRSSRKTREDTTKDNNRKKSKQRRRGATLAQVCCLSPPAFPFTLYGDINLKDVVYTRKDNNDNNERDKERHYNDINDLYTVTNINKVVMVPTFKQLLQNYQINQIGLSFFFFKFHYTEYKIFSNCCIFTLLFGAILPIV